MRPLIERAAVMSYLCLHPEAVDLWHGGWKHRERPSLVTMLQAMAGEKADPQEAKKVCHAHNHIVHGDPIASYYNLVHLGDGRAAYASSKILDSPDLADPLAMEAQCYLVVLAGRMSQVFPRVEIPAMADPPERGGNAG